ncbi:DUF2624 domain-containing protein [Bacillus sp. EB01]|uniref:DUF2624 domain-containing protein n=1 Tax=Bacillus sp. EB01 TaxID=1347086 RepID=UPI0005C5B82D|nr:DUF2624 domain-containing protein [Bacillus sp. EB01]
MKLFENIINHKINTITDRELLNYANQFGISINQKQADLIAKYLRGRQINIFNSAERTTIIKEIARIAGPDTAREVNKLFLQFTK